jgi:hypothetical protein
VIYYYSFFVKPYLDQTGFISGRYIGDNIRLIYDMLQFTEENDIPGLLLLIDFEKAFDSISWDFLLYVLKFFNFGDDVSSANCDTLCPILVTFIPPIFLLPLS